MHSGVGMITTINRTEKLSTTETRGTLEKKKQQKKTTTGASKGRDVLEATG